MTTMTTTITDTLRLLAWLSPAFPTGGFAYSHGLEWAVENGDIKDGPTLQSWIEDIIRHGAGRTDATLLRHAHRAAADPKILAQITELARATSPSRERLAETIGQGNAFRRAATSWNPPDQDGDIPYPVAVGALAGKHNIPEDTACAAALQTFAANLISAAVRLVPLGQSTGLSVLAALEPTIAEIAMETTDATLEDLGTATFRADLAAMHHETQYTRLFRS